MSLESGPKTAHPEAITEKDETKLFSLEKSFANPEAKRVMVTFDNPGAYNGLAPIVDALVRDPRCKGVSVLTSGWGSRQFRKDERAKSFKEIPPVTDLAHPARETVFADILQESETSRYDIVLASGSAKDGPESAALFAGKANFGASTLFFFIDGWGTTSWLTEATSRAEENAPLIDGIFCCDEMAKRLAMRALPGIPVEKFRVSGSPVIDGLYVENSEEFTETARRKLGLAPDEVAVLYAGDVPGDYGADMQIDGEHIDMRSLDRVIEAMRHAAQKEPQKKFALLVRPHPRNAPEYQKEQVRHASSAQVPPNMAVRDASYPDVSIQEARYAADAVASIVSTENFLMPRIGRPAISLALSEAGMGGAVIRKLYGEIGEDMRHAEPLLSFVHTPEELAVALLALRRAPGHVENQSEGSTSTERILDMIFTTPRPSSDA